MSLTPTNTDSVDAELREQALTKAFSDLSEALADIEYKYPNGGERGAPIAAGKAYKKYFNAIDAVYVAQARKGYVPGVGSSKLDSVQVADFCIAMSDRGVIVLPIEGAEILAWHQAELDQKVAEARRQCSCPMCEFHVSAGSQK